MALRSDLLSAFHILGLHPNDDLQTATKAYKRLALINHPDRNPTDPKATQRFQEIGAAWNICQRHYDNSSWSHSHPHHFDPDDDIPLSQDELPSFYIFVFFETVSDRYTRAKGQRYRYERSGRAGGGLATFSGGLAESQARQASNTERQKKENEEYEKRKRELELEIEQEERENSEKESQFMADADRRDHALEHAFRAASSGDPAVAKKAILEYDLDVNSPRKRSRHSRKQDSSTLSDSLLHVAASNCDGDFFMFLLERGAIPTALNRNQLNPFHSAVKAGNIRVVQFILEQRGRSFDSFHPSKATASGCTPLQLAIESGVPSVVELLVKYATTHDVDRCWKVETISEDVKQILLKKKGFVPPDNSAGALKSAPLNKLRPKQELDHDKKARIAEELERAAVNRQKREDRATRFLEKQRADATVKLEQARRKAELEELDRLENDRKALEAREKHREEKGLPAEADRRAVASGSKVVKEESKISRRQEEKRPSLNLRTATKVGSNFESQISSSSQTLPAHSHSKDVKTLTPLSLPEEKAENKRHAKSKLNRLTKLNAKDRRNDEQLVKAPVPENPGLQSRDVATPKHSLVNSDSVEIHHSYSKGTQKIPAKDTESLEEARKRKEEAILRRRAEQSARDKERHRRKLDEQAKQKHEQSTKVDISDYTPLTPVSTHTTIKPAKIATAKTTKSNELNPIAPPNFSFVEFLIPREDLQTCTVPEDLFRDEPPIARAMANEGGSVTPESNRERGRYKWRGRRRPLERV